MPTIQLGLITVGLLNLNHYVVLTIDSVKLIVPQPFNQLGRRLLVNVLALPQANEILTAALGYANDLLQATFDL